MRPIEEFVYVGNQVIVPDQASLMRCYYPIIVLNPAVLGVTA